MKCAKPSNPCLDHAWSSIVQIVCIDRIKEFVDWDAPPMVHVTRAMDRWSTKCHAIERGEPLGPTTHACMLGGALASATCLCTPGCTPGPPPIRACESHSPIGLAWPVSYVVWLAVGPKLSCLLPRSSSLWASHLHFVLNFFNPNQGAKS